MILPLLVFALASALDAWTTCRALAHGGRELNPLYGDHSTPSRVWTTKAIGVLIGGYALWAFPELAPVAYIAGAVTAAVAVRNYRLY